MDTVWCFVITVCKGFFFFRGWGFQGPLLLLCVAGLKTHIPPSPSSGFKNVMSWVLLLWAPAPGLISLWGCCEWGAEPVPFHGSPLASGPRGLRAPGPGWAHPAAATAFPCAPAWNTCPKRPPRGGESCRLFQPCLGFSV